MIDGGKRICHICMSHHCGGCYGKQSAVVGAKHEARIIGINFVGGVARFLFFHTSIGP